MLRVLGTLVALVAASGADFQLPPGFRTDLSKASIQLSELTPGGPPRDGIPALTEPRFESVGSASAWLDGAEPVLVVRHAGQARVYPFQILVWHELVNDRIGGLPVLASFCPLCNAAVAFDRRVDGGVAEFGVSGLLRHSDMVMFDRETDSLWQQLTGEAIVGAHVGQRLRVIASQVAPFRAVSAAFPEARVLGRDTGHERAYGTTPYPNYEAGGRLLFPVPFRRPGSIGPLERMLAFRAGAETIGYRLRELRGNPVRNGGPPGGEYVVFYDPDMVTALGSRRIAESARVGAAGVFSPVVAGERLVFEAAEEGFVDRNTGSLWNLFGQATRGPLQGATLAPIKHGVHYSFAWFAFRPETRFLRLPGR